MKKSTRLNISAEIAYWFIFAGIWLARTDDWLLLLGIAIALRAFIWWATCILMLINEKDIK